MTTLRDVPPDEAELSFAIVTQPTRRKCARRVALEGKRRHLHVTHEHDGGWLSRYHLITARGDASAVKRYQQALLRWQEALERAAAK